MNALIRLFARVCLFRSGPEAMPYAPPLVAMLLGVWLLVQLLNGLLQANITSAEMVGVQMLSMGLMLGATALLLAFKGRQGRWCQTALALIGVDIALSLASLPLLLLNQMAGQHLPFIDGLYLILVAWQLAVQSFIYHRALDVSPLLGLALAFGLLVLTFMLLGIWMPEVLEAAK